MAFTTGTDDYGNGVLGWGVSLIHSSEAEYAVFVQAAQSTNDLSIPTRKWIRLLRQRKGGSGVEKSEKRKQERTKMHKLFKPTGFSLIWLHVVTIRTGWLVIHFLPRRMVHEHRLWDRDDQ